MASSTKRTENILDVGHNEQGVHAIVNQLDNESYDHLHIMLGFSAEKETERILALFPKDATFYITKSPMIEVLIPI